MNKLTLVLSIIFTFYSIFLFAQFPVEGPYQSVYTNDTPILPDHLSSVVDNTLPSSINIKRLTDYYEPWDWYPIMEYAKYQTWNKDQSLYRIRSVWVFDAVTNEIVRDLPGGDIYPSYWSNTDSDLIYCFSENGEIKTYSVANDNLTTVFTIEGYDIIKLGPGEGNIDKNDKYVALIGRRGGDLDIIIFDLESNQIVHTEIIEGGWGDGQDWSPEYIDWISVSQSGEYVGIMWNHNTTSKTNPYNGHYGVEIYNTLDMTFLRRIAAYGNHGDFGYATDGDEVFVQFWGPTGAVSMYYLDRLERKVIATHNDFKAAGHISCRNINRPGWAYLTQSSASQSGQIIALKLDDSGIVEHFGHHFSSSTTYDKAPMAVPSPNGDKVMFKSDFGDAADHDVVYVFEASLDGYVLNSFDIQDDEVNNVKLYPNPSNGLINIESDAMMANIEIFNNVGQKVLDVKNVDDMSTRLNIEHFEKGIYLLRTTTDKGKRTTKLFVKI